MLLHMPMSFVIDPNNEFNIAERCLQQLQKASTSSVEYLDDATSMKDICIASVDMPAQLPLCSNPVPGKGIAKPKKRRKAQAPETTQAVGGAIEVLDTAPVVKKPRRSRKRPAATEAGGAEPRLEPLPDWPEDILPDCDIEGDWELISGDLGI